MPALLIGDSGQHDASVNAQVAREHPDRVAAVYVRDVDPGSDSEYDVRVDEVIETFAEAGVPFLRVQDSDDVARHALELGLLPASALPAIEADTAADESQPLPLGEDESS